MTARRAMAVALLIPAAVLAADVFLSMAKGPAAMTFGGLTPPAGRGQAEVAIASTLAAAALFLWGAAKKRWGVPSIIGLLTLGALHANTRTQSSADSAATAVLPFMLVREHTFALDRATWIHHRDGPGAAYYLVFEPERVLSTYPVATAVLATPFYLPAALGRFDPEVDSVRNLEKLAGAGLTAIGTALLFAALRRLVREKVALAATACWVFGTAVSPVLGQALWQHTGAAFALCAALWALSWPAETRGRAVWVGVFAGLATDCRPLDVILGAAVVLMLWRDGRRPFVTAALAAVAMVVPLAAYDSWAFGAPWRTGYGSIAREGFGGNWPEGFAGLLFSPARGLFVLSPLLLFALVPLFRRFRWLLAGFALYVCVFASWTWWHGGFAPGQRYLSDPLPLLAVGFAFGLEAVLDSKSRAKKIALGVAVAWSVGVNALLTYVPPRPAVKAVVWNLEEGPFSVRAFPPVGYLSL